MARGDKTGTGRGRSNPAPAMKKRARGGLRMPRGNSAYEGGPLPAMKKPKKMSAHKSKRCSCDCKGNRLSKIALAGFAVKMEKGSATIYLKLAEGNKAKYLKGEVVELVEGTSFSYKHISESEYDQIKGNPSYLSGEE